MDTCAIIRYYGYTLMDFKEAPRLVPPPLLLLGECPPLLKTHAILTRSCQHSQTSFKRSWPCLAGQISGFRLLKIRNVWGHQEWSGEWSDESPLWEQHPEVKEACQMTSLFIAHMSIYGNNH